MHQLVGVMAIFLDSIRWTKYTKSLLNLWPLYSKPQILTWIECWGFCFNTARRTLNRKIAGCLKAIFLPVSAILTNMQPS